MTGLKFKPIKRSLLAFVIVLTLLSILNITLKSDKLNSQTWSLSVEIKVTAVTLFLVFFILLPTLLPWIISFVPQIQDSIKWLRNQGIEQIETSVLKIKLRYGLEEASKNYEEKIWTPGTVNSISQDTFKQLEIRYRDAISLINSKGDIGSAEALNQIDQLGEYYDRVREEMPSGSSRTRLMTEISSTMWALISKTLDFPVHKRIVSPKGGERLSAYKYIEWQPSNSYLNLLLPRSIGVLEVPFGQYSALLALRRVVTTNKIDSGQAREIIDLLSWAPNIEYFGSDRQSLMISIVSLLS
jgi:hypothetical protein